MLLRRKVFLHWTGTRSICRKGTLPGSARFPIKPLLCLIPSTFCTSRREQRADIKTTASDSNPPAKGELLLLRCSQQGPRDSASGRLPQAAEMHVQLLGNCSIKRVWCISHCASVCTEAWEVKANSSPPFPHPILYALCHWACLGLQTPPSRESL